MDGQTAPRPFVFVLHDHQPLGNFDSVFEAAFERAYEPTTRLVEQHPKIRIGLHLSGPLLEWIAKKRRPFLDRVRALVERGQVEILGGGFYEPILSVLPDCDAAGQVEMMSMFCQRYFGARPEGVWLAERVWDPDLPRMLAANGVRYTLVDDSHFITAGVARDRVTGHWITEKASVPLTLFPIDRGLRYRIPFAPPEEVVAYIEQAPGTGCVVYGDDGEKLGLWPNTHQLVAEERWLERFFLALAAAEDAGRVTTVLPGRHRMETAPAGRVYPAGGAYAEMSAWAMPSLGAEHLSEVRRQLDAREVGDVAEPFLRGAIWPSFLVKYPEANHLHKKMLYVSQRLQVALDDEMRATRASVVGGDRGDLLGTAQRELYGAQCACAYWHGLFGGVHFEHLRGAAWKALISAEAILDRLQQGDEDWVAYEELDLDVDGREEILAGNRNVDVYLRPHEGGAVFELDFKPRALAIADVLAHRPEPYHRMLATDEERAMLASAPYDLGPRTTFLDRFFSSDLSLHGIDHPARQDAGDFSTGEYQVERLAVDESADPACEVVLARTGTVRMGELEWSVRLTKTYRLGIDARHVAVKWSIENLGATALTGWFATELNLTLRSSEDPARHYRVGGNDARWSLGASQLHEGVRELILVDETERVRVELDTPVEATWIHRPVVTVARSEGVLAKHAQGSCFMPAWRVELLPGASTELSFSIGFSEVGE